MNDEIRQVLLENGASKVGFANISFLPEKATKGLPKAIVFCLAIQREDIIAMRCGTKNVLQTIIAKENEADATADLLSLYLTGKGYNAFSLSFENICLNNCYDADKLMTALPHKTIALLAGIGFIGKNKLLITEEYGCAFAMSAVLTDAPLTVKESCVPVTAKCGTCNECKDTCPVNAVSGFEWTESGGRDAVVDVFKCNPDCLTKCMLNCAFTLKYAMQAS
jgi:epoxyqueuosine reductase QueG